MRQTVFGTLYKGMAMSRQQIKSMNMYEMENFFDDSNIAYSEIACESMQ